MKKSQMKLLSILLTLVTLLCLIPFGAEASDYKNGDTIEFGMYPSSLETDTEIIAKLNSMTIEMRSYGYYINNSQSDFMQFGDIEYNGAKYRKVYFSSYRPYWTKNPSSYTEQKTNGYYTDTIYWFKYEPISWTILDSNSGLILCNNILDSRDFHHKDSYPTWELSDIRAWLNEDFYNTAFTDTEKQQIEISKIETPDYNGIDGGADTEDKLFFLSYDEVLNTSYGFSSNYSEKDTARRKTCTEYAKCQGLWQSNNYGDWWLRTAGNNSSRAKIIDYDGAVNIYNNINNTGVTSIGVLPAMKINLTDKKDEAEFIRGDVNRDGKVTAADARIVLRAAAQIEMLNEADKEIAEVTGDDKITAADARIILRIAAQLEKPEEETDDDFDKLMVDANCAEFKGTYTANQGVTGLTLTVFIRDELLNDESALQNFANIATECSNNQKTFTVEDIKNIVNNHTDKYIAFFNFYPVEENPNVEKGLYTMTVNYDEESENWDFYGYQWVQKDTYSIVDLVDALITEEDDKVTLSSSVLMFDSVVGASNLTLTKNEFVEGDLDRLAYVLDSHWCSEFDYHTADTAEVVDHIIAPDVFMAGYGCYFDDNEAFPSNSYTPIDPLGKFNFGYHKLPIDQVKWICENIYHVEFDEQYSSDESYCYNGYVYCDYAEIGHDPEQVEIDSYVITPDGKYEAVAVKTFGDRVMGTYNVVADWQLIDGEYDWTFYSIEEI